MGMYTDMEVRGPLIQVGYWEGEFSRHKFRQEPGLGRYVNAVVAFDLKWGIITIYSLRDFEIPDQVAKVSFTKVFFIDGDYASSGFDYQKKNARKVFQELYAYTKVKAK